MSHYVALFACLTMLLCFPVSLWMCLTILLYPTVALHVSHNCETAQLFGALLQRTYRASVRHVR